MTEKHMVTGGAIIGAFLFGIGVGFVARRPVPAASTVKVEAKQTAAVAAPVATSVEHHDADHAASETGARIVRSRIKRPDGSIERKETIDCTGVASGDTHATDTASVVAAPSATAAQAVAVAVTPQSPGRPSWVLAAVAPIVSQPQRALSLSLQHHVIGGLYAGVAVTPADPFRLPTVVLSYTW